jgi:hypothetical protein
MSNGTMHQATRLFFRKTSPAEGSCCERDLGIRAAIRNIIEEAESVFIFFGQFRERDQCITLSKGGKEFSLKDVLIRK